MLFVFYFNLYTPCPSPSYFWGHVCRIFLFNCVENTFSSNKGALVTILALGLWPRQGVARLQAKRKTRESYHMLLGVPKSVREWTLTLPNELPCWELESQWTLKSSEHNRKGQNPLPWRVLYIIGNLLKRRCLKWACIAHLDIWNISYDQNKRPIVKLVVWLLIIKSQESTQFSCVQAMCDILLERSWPRLQLFFRPHYNRKSARQIMRLQSRNNPNFGNFEIPIWESQDKKPFGCGPHGEL